MRKSAYRILSLGVAVPALSAMLCAGSAQAQVANPAPTAAEAASDDAANADIIVTGTLLRGERAVGTNVVSYGADAIAESGASNTMAALARVPQISSSFNSMPALNQSDPGSTVVRPNIRNLAGAGGTTTLVLIDGHRTASTGILQTSVDPDIIAVGAIERIDVQPDGGSATYGSDAVGGVINLITRRSFDGVQADARYGFADGYKSFDLNLTAGQIWDTGSAYLTYNYARHGEIQGKERDYIRQVAANSISCAPGTVSIDRGGTVTNYALPGRTPGTVSTCDYTDQSSFVPAVSRHSVFGRLIQELGEGIEFDISGFYTRRDITAHIDLNSGDFSQSRTITTDNPYYVPIAPDTGTQTVNFSFAGVANNRRENNLEQFGITPTVKAELGGGWQLRVLGGYGISTLRTNGPGIDGTQVDAALAGTTFANALNPYDPGASNAAVLRSILFRQAETGRQKYYNARAIIDGSPVTLPGGDVKLAVGAEFTRETFDTTIVSTVAASGTGKRKIGAVFGELSVPVIGADNASPGLSALTLSASGRYDDYSDVGSTFNPKLGVNYSPVDWLTFRANWGTSFNAPSLADTTGAPDTRAILINSSPGVFVDPADGGADLPQPLAILAGGNANLKPQTADTWSLGFDARPVGGLSISATWYNIKIKNQIQIVPLFNAASLYTPAYSPWVIKSPSLADATALIGSLRLEGATSVANWYADPDGSPYAIIDARRQNLGVLKQDGIDFNITYDQDTGFGSVNAGFAGTYTLHRKLAALPGAPYTNELKVPGISRFGFVGSLGAKTGGFSGTATWTHSAGYDIVPIGSQDKVKAFDVFDLYFTYDVGGEGALGGLTLSAYIGNVFDKNPPSYNLNPGFTNGSTLGRFVQFGISKKF